jgi:hypothetical protein
MENSLREYGIINPDDIFLITKIRKTLNKVARVKYVHHSDYYNPHDPRNILTSKSNNEVPTNNNLGIAQILNKPVKTWTGIEWLNVYSIYEVIVQNLIYLKYFAIK